MLVTTKRLQAWAMLWLGRRLFAFVKTWAPKENQAPTVMHFAHSERDFNTACRQHVEELDGWIEFNPADQQRLEGAWTSSNQ